MSKISKERKREYALRNYYKKRAAGICADCPEPARTGRRTCSQCAKKRAEKEQRERFQGVFTRRKEKRIAAGKCTKCNNTTRPGFRLCEDCKEYSNLRRKKLKNRGACQTCGRLARQGLTTCSQCAAKNRFMFTGWTCEEYEKATTEQQGLCAICRKLPGKRSLSADHCHKTGQKRALLCSRCNGTLGYFEKWEQSITDYLRRFRDEQPTTRNEIS